MSVQARDAAQEFGFRFGRVPMVSRAPGRVNLIGEHTDYNDGFVMPAALDFATLTAASPRPDRRLRVHSLIMDETREFDLDAPEPARRDWSDYVFGVAAMLEKSGRRLVGADLVVWTDVPLGSGLSSSAALEVSVAHALLIAAGLPFEPVAVAKICQHAENDYVGMRCGIMDQYVSACGVAGARAPDRLPLARIAQRPDRAEPETTHRQFERAPPARGRRIQRPARGLRGGRPAPAPLSRADHGLARRDAESARPSSPRPARARLSPLPPHRHRKRARARGRTGAEGRRLRRLRRAR